MVLARELLVYLLLIRGTTIWVGINFCYLKN